MSVADAVAALPGGGEFAALWDQVNGDPGAIADLTSTLHQAAGRAQDGAHGVGKAAGEVGESWHGPAAQAFSGYMHRFRAAASSVHAALDKAGTAVQDAATSVAGAKDQVSSIASRILDAADRARASLDPDDPEAARRYEGAVRQAVLEGCAEAQPVVQRLVGDLEQAASSVHAALATPAFRDMTAANDHTYLPPPGKPIEWNPIPKGLDPGTGGTTAPAGAEASGGGGVPAAAPGGTSAPSAMPTGDVAHWIADARKILIARGVPSAAISDADINMIIQHESAGDPHAQNNWDSNAAAGHPSKGLMQTIDSTFDSYSLPGHKDIWNPVDNIIAGVRYALSRYGSLDNVPGIAAVHSGGSYVGY